MTKEQLIYKLKTDPRYLIQAVIFNNPNDVQTNLSNYTDAAYDSIDQIIDSVYGLLAAGEVERVDEIMQVPFKENNAKPILLDAYEQMVSDRANTVDGASLDSSRGLYLLAKSSPATPQNGANMINHNSKKGICGCSKDPMSWCNKKIIGIKIKYVIGAAILLIILYLFFRNRTKIIKV